MQRVDLGKTLLEMSILSDKDKLSLSSQTNALFNGSKYPALMTRILVFGAKDLVDIPKTLLNFRRVYEFSFSVEAYEAC